MKAISLWQPWASAIALGIKQVETRSFQTSYRGEIAICASKKNNSELAEIFEWLQDIPEIGTAFEKGAGTDLNELPFGRVVAVVTLYAVHPTMDLMPTISNTELALGDYSMRSIRWGWLLRNVHRLKTPVPVVGRQSLFNLPPDVESKVREQL